MFQSRGQHVGEWIERVICCGCRVLPCAVDGERVEEWCAEVPAILGDSRIRFGWMRTLRAVTFAVGTLWAARKLEVKPLSLSLRQQIGAAAVVVMIMSGLEFARAGNAPAKGYLRLPTGRERRWARAVLLTRWSGRIGRALLTVRALSAQDFAELEECIAELKDLHRRLT